MLERDGYPPGGPCWVDTGQPDPEAAAGFYGDLFGWKLEDRMPPDAPGRYLVAQLRDRDVAAVGSQPEGAPATPGWNTYICVESADQAATKVTNAGGQVLSAPFDVPGAGRMGVFADPSGAAFCVWEAREHKGAQLVNEPGTWVFSGLNTRDLDGAKAFYGAVFGWEVDTLTMEDGDEFMFWRLPGYADFLAARDPDLRRRQAADGAPAGYADAVASLAPMTGFPDEVPPHWSVTFAVDDADGIADRAAQLGGKISVPPFDAGPTRLAILADPQGAAFAVSKYQPA
ncbi:MAG: VOC family protein [Solirubrobacterales bacterium]|nr:VOC family protein [Solirubrobacterales bacterium]